MNERDKQLADAAGLVLYIKREIAFDSSEDFGIDEAVSVLAGQISYLADMQLDLLAARELQVQGGAVTA